MDSRTNFIEHKNELLSFAFAPADLFLDQPAAAALRVARIEHKDHNVALIDDFV